MLDSNFLLSLVIEKVLLLSDIVLRFLCIYTFLRCPESKYHTFTFYDPYNDRESVVFWSDFRNGDFDGFTHHEVP